MLAGEGWRWGGGGEELLRESKKHRETGTDKRTDTNTHTQKQTQTRTHRHRCISTGQRLTSMRALFVVVMTPGSVMRAAERGCAVVWRAFGW